MRLLKTLLTAGLFLVLTHAANAQDRPRVVAVNYPLQYMADRLLGDTAEVVLPVPQDVDPSFWRPSIADISMIQSADLILLNGAGFATWVDRVSLPRSKLVNTTSAIKNQFIVTESITHSHGDGGEHSHDGLASYVWLDPTLAIAQAEAIAGAIASRQLAPAEDVYRRLEALRLDLDALDAEAQTALSGFEDTAIITTHPRYQYLARRYGLTISSLEWGAGAMPDDVELAELGTLVKETNASVLIWEAQPPANAFAATKVIGLQNIVFPPMAHAPGSDNFLDGFRAALSAMSDANRQ
ncbi:MAG: metal ABC transporter substrate-binding protein [Pseudomonadota bacterium]